MNPISIGALLSGLGVIFGAFGTHGLRGKIGYDLLQIYETGTHYMIIHAAAILMYGLWHRSQPAATRPKCWPATAFLVGIVIFTGSLYTITFTAIREFGMITPVGGVLMIVGWIGFGKQAWNK
ncbi:MAG: DUF423 domain-containing protein [Bdellovibrionales bacterium]|nr:DUF423 domain-containing protein [Bdellovibrionales bacterium]